MASERDRTGSGARKPSRGVVFALLGAAIAAVLVPLLLVPLFSDGGGSPDESGAGAVAPPPPSDPLPQLPEPPRPTPAAAAPPAGPAPVAGTASDSGSLGVRVIEIVDAATELPIPHAEVFHRDADGPFRPREFGLLIAGRRSARADERGRAAIEWPAESDVLVLARAPGRAGGAVVAPPRSPDDVARLPLLPDWDLAVEVVDAALAPAPRVPIARRDASRDGTYIEIVPTDDAGRVVFPHAGLRISAANPKPEIEVSVNLPLLEKLSRQVDPETAPLEPVRFTLPAAGSLAVRVLDAKRAPVADGTNVDMALILPGESRDVSPFARQDRIRASRPTRLGVALFEHVELGVDLEVRVTGETSEPKARDVVAGPKAPGETVEATLVIGVDHPVLVFRAVDEAGAPLSREKLELHSTFRSANMANSGNAFTTTDDDGVFEHALPARFLDGDKRTLRVEARGGEIGTLVDLSRAFEPGTNDMGDLPLVLPPLLVAGRVVDERGNPAAGANVQVEIPVRDAAAPDRVWYWNEVPAAAVSDRDGRFAARAFVSERTVRATARRDALRSASVECAFGTGDVTLVLAGVGTVLGSVKLDPGVPGDALEARLGPSGVGGGERSQADVDAERSAVEPSGDFRFDARLPGTYRFSLRLRGMADEDDAELVAFDGVEVAGGKETRDPRLQDIDLRSRLGAFRLDLVPPAGSTGELKGNATFHASGTDGGTPQWKWFQGSPVTLVSPSESIDVALAVTGYRTVRLENLRGDREVKLEPALVVRLALPASFDIPRPPVHVKAALVPETGNATPDFAGSAFDDAREIRALAPGVGRMKVVWIVERRAGDSASATTVEVEPEQFVEVREDGGEQRFVLDVTNEALERAMTRKQ